MLLALLPFFLDDVELMFDVSNVRLKNKRFGTVPIVVHGNGPSKLYLNHLGNYLANSWTFDDGCLSCVEDTFALQGGQVWHTLPNILQFFVYGEYGFFGRCSFAQ